MTGLLAVSAAAHDSKDKPDQSSDGDYFSSAPSSYGSGKYIVEFDKGQTFMQSKQ